LAVCAYGVENEVVCIAGAAERETERDGWVKGGDRRKGESMPSMEM